ncbi:G-alpha-domain-containing protein [Gloeophyllum trabeum ATCC 11539]|uniref:G-alpha-domain-containing protein n=1 Tax=Gloeophyllum trabeum (strain ATCC 11539 / FP-39264 / Madison 617) TaxID=670483 RepID=S7RLB2_GLOTA|nr:G-alpha-domain-containing protein [Gloeophyllum trabeum ATCC 11539]EPQ53454.1 G-alpha-domain-containing protein [Gloeophyllum trabeum ATCC 11539]
MPVRVSMSDDPFSALLAPPPDEMPAERAARLREEENAKRISDAIDEEISRQRAEQRRERCVKRLTMSGCTGKSTTLKNFQLMNSRKAFRAERAQWRTVIQLNIVRSFRLILEAMAEAQAATTSPATSSPSVSPRLRPADDPDPDPNMPHLTSELLLLKMKLSPLIQIEETLLRALDPEGSSVFGAPYLTALTNLPNPERPRGKGVKEIAVNSCAWGTKFSRLLSGEARNSTDVRDEGLEPDEPSHVLHACSDDMIRLWKDPIVREVLDRLKLRLEEMPGFFLDDLERVTDLNYMPSDADIVRARIKTLGVTEYRFTVKGGLYCISPFVPRSLTSNAVGNSISRDWRLYDVGGQRSCTAAWVPFFDDMDAIIFLAPISCFDQVLEEDPSVNRLEDSVLLWKSIVSNPVLARTNIILFLNKCDIMRRKLAAGIKLSKYIVSYGDRPNDFESTSTYLRRKFAQIHKDHSVQKREFYAHFTSVVDIEATTKILADVQDSILRANLRGTGLIL